MIQPRVCRAVGVAVPAAVPLPMATVFAVLRRHMTGPTAYNIGFVIYWLGWCLAVPLWLVGPRSAARLLTTGRRLPRPQVALLATPVVGAVATQLLPHRKDVDAPTAAVMVATAVVNAVGEELLWRAMFMAMADRRRPLTMAWSLAGFSAWHLAPQIILPSQMGRVRFVVGSAVVGIASTSAAHTAGGLRQVVVAHAITDACGVRAARFRLGRLGR